MDCSPPGSSVHEILQARILEWVALPSSKDLPNPGIEPESLMSPFPGRQVLLPLAPPGKSIDILTYWLFPACFSSCVWLVLFSSCLLQSSQIILLKLCTRHHSLPLSLKKEKNPLSTALWDHPNPTDFLATESPRPNPWTFLSGNLSIWSQWFTHYLCWFPVFTDQCLSNISTIDSSNYRGGWLKYKEGDVAFKLCVEC